MQILIKGARVLDPGNIDDKKDIIIKDNIIKAIVDPGESESKAEYKIIDAKNMLVVPGLIDIH
ncbi:MAG: dihydroorotase, partial [Thermodesulfobacteriota bacterium]